MTAHRGALAPPPAFHALADLLAETAVVIARLSRGQYADSAVAGVSGSIGGHVRHCLDHVRALESGLDRGLVDYDARRRDTVVERDRDRAVQLLTAAAARLGTIPDATLPRVVVVRSLLAADGPVVEAASSVSRELAFVISHTIHHHALIALLAERLGCGCLAGRFGVAPSTPVAAGAA